VGKGAAGPPKAGGSEHLELHGVFSITLRAPGAELLSKFGFFALCGAQNLHASASVEGEAGSSRRRRARFVEGERLQSKVGELYAKENYDSENLQAAFALFTDASMLINYWLALHPSEVKGLTDAAPQTVGDHVPGGRL
jgi:hypothetical protein